MTKRIRDILRYISFIGLLAAASTPASAIPINVAFGDISVSGQSETVIGNPFCPPDISCDFRPGARVFRATVAISQRVQTPNPLEINLIDDFFSPGDLTLDEETLAFWEERSAASKARIKTLKKMVKTKQRELRTKRSLRRPSARIVEPSNDIDPFLFSVEYDPDDFIPPYLVLNVVDTVTGEFSDTRIQLASVPEPSILPLMGVGILGMLALSRRKRSLN